MASTGDDDGGEGRRKGRKGKERACGRLFAQAFQAKPGWGLPDLDGRKEFGEKDGPADCRNKPAKGKTSVEKTWETTYLGTYVGMCGTVWWYVPKLCT